MNTLIKSIDSLSIVQIGAGGTGGWLIPLMTKFLNNIQMKLGERINTFNLTYIICDDDKIESHNPMRQNFMENEIGDYKVDSLMRRYVGTFRNIYALRKKMNFEKKEIKIRDDININKSLIIYIGCTDSITARLGTVKFMKKYQIPSIYIDSGNGLNDGQILTYCHCLEKLKNIDNTNELVFTYFNEKYKAAMFNFNEFFKKQNNSSQEEVSCAFFGDQSQSTNNMAAAFIFAELQNIIINVELPSPIRCFLTRDLRAMEDYTMPEMALATSVAI